MSVCAGFQARTSIEGIHPLGTFEYNEGEFARGDPWVERCRRREEGAWAEFFTRYHAFVRHSARRLGTDSAEVDDVVQEAFTVAFKHIHTFEHGRMTTWLFRLVSNLVSNRHRARRVREGFLALVGRQPVKVQRNPEEAWEAREAQTLVHQLIARLSPKKRDVFALFELEGLSGDEIAQLLDLNIGTVWTRLHHARKDFELLARKAGVAS